MEAAWFSEEGFDSGNLWNSLTSEASKIIEKVNNYDILNMDVMAVLQEEEEKELADEEIDEEEEEEDGNKHGGKSHTVSNSISNHGTNIPYDNNKSSNNRKYDNEQEEEGGCENIWDDSLPSEYSKPPHQRQTDGVNQMAAVEERATVMEFDNSPEKYNFSSPLSAPLPAVHGKLRIGTIGINKKRSDKSSSINNRDTYNLSSIDPSSSSSTIAGHSIESVELNSNTSVIAINVTDVSSPSSTRHRYNEDNIGKDDDNCQSPWEWNTPQMTKIKPNKRENARSRDKIVSFNDAINSNDVNEINSQRQKRDTIIRENALIEETDNSSSSKSKSTSSVNSHGKSIYVAVDQCIGDVSKNEVDQSYNGKKKSSRSQKSKTREKKKLDFWGISSSSSSAISSSSSSANTTTNHTSKPALSTEISLLFEPVGMPSEDPDPNPDPIMGSSTSSSSSSSGNIVSNEDKHSYNKIKPSINIDVSTRGSESLSSVFQSAFEAATFSAPLSTSSSTTFDPRHPQRLSTGINFGSALQAFSFFDNVDEEVDLNTDPILQQIRMNKENPNSRNSSKQSSFPFSLQLFGNDTLKSEKEKELSVECDRYEIQINNNNNSSHHNNNSNPSSNLENEGAHNISPLLKRLWEITIVILMYLWYFVSTILRSLLSIIQEVLSLFLPEGWTGSSAGTVSWRSLFEGFEAMNRQQQIQLILYVFWEHISSVNGISLMTGSLFVYSYFKFARYATDAGDR